MGGGLEILCKKPSMKNLFQLAGDRNARLAKMEY
jgi:hypothetical protein